MDIENRIILVGLLADLTGPTADHDGLRVAAQIAYWRNLNDRGGIDGWTVEPVIRDSGGDGEAHLAAYGELRGEVVAFSHSGDTALTLGIIDRLESDEMLAIPNDPRVEMVRSG